MKNQTDQIDACDAQVCAPTPAELEEFRHAVGTIIGKWKIEILWVLLPGARRFGELRRALPGVTQHMLTAQLRALEADQLVTRTAYAEIPPRVDYELTPRALALKPIFLALMEWAHTTGEPSAFLSSRAVHE